MPYRIEYREADNILHVTLSGQISLEERVAIWKELIERSPGNRRVLADARELTNFVDVEQSTQLQTVYRALGHPLRKVALVHRPHFNPYVVLSSFAVLEGLDVEEFTDLAVAEAWLRETP